MDYPWISFCVCKQLAILLRHFATLSYFVFVTKLFGGNMSVCLQLSTKGSKVVLSPINDEADTLIEIVHGESTRRHIPESNQGIENIQWLRRLIFANANFYFFPSRHGQDSRTALLHCLSMIRPKFI